MKELFIHTTPQPVSQETLITVAVFGLVVIAIIVIIYILLFTIIDDEE